MGYLRSRPALKLKAQLRNMEQATIYIDGMNMIGRLSFDTIGVTLSDIYIDGMNKIGRFSFDTTGFTLNVVPPALIRSCTVIFIVLSSVSA